jgi:hypothetical protein
MVATLKQLNMLQRNVRFWGVRLYDGREQAPMVAMTEPAVAAIIVDLVELVVVRWSDGLRCRCLLDWSAETV